MNPYPVADLHCDLLAYLQGDASRTAHHPEVRCSLSQMQAGGVQWQTMAIYTTTTADSVQSGQQQFEIFKKLSSRYPEFDNLIKISLAIENASGFCSEDEPLETGFSRLSRMIKEVSPLYISFTWNDENRFGGGNRTSVGLKEDGCKLLDYLDQKKIAVDFSHTSDQLANDILNYIDKHNLDIRVIASHSNFRNVCDVPRNLPDTIAQEIVRRKGLIGLNVIAAFNGPDPQRGFVPQIEHALKLGAEKHICFGADFFYEGDVPVAQRKSPEYYYFSDYNDASAYKRILQLYKSHLGLSEKTLQRISSENYRDFFYS